MLHINVREGWVNGPTIHIIVKGFPTSDTIHWWFLVICGIFYDVLYNFVVLLLFCYFCVSVCSGVFWCFLFFLVFLGNF